MASVNSNEFIERTEARIDELLDELQSLITTQQQKLNEKLLKFASFSERSQKELSQNNSTPADSDTPIVDIPIETQETSIVEVPEASSIIEETPLNDSTADISIAQNTVEQSADLKENLNFSAIDNSQIEESFNENSINDSALEYSNVTDSTLDDSALNESSTSTKKQKKEKLRECGICLKKKPSTDYSGHGWRSKPPRCKVCAELNRVNSSSNLLKTNSNPNLLKTNSNSNLLKA